MLGTHRPGKNRHRTFSVKHVRIIVELYVRQDTSEDTFAQGRESSEGNSELLPSGN